jgi:hypothetical protein
VGAVGADQPAGPDELLRPAGMLPERDGDAAAVLVEGGQLGAETDLGPGEPAQVAEQDRLQVVLGHGGRRRRAGRGRLLEVGEARRHRRPLGGGERPGGEPPGVGEVELPGPDLVLQAPGAQHLHGADADARGPRQRRQAGVAFHQQRADAVAGQGDRRDQAGRPGPGDHHRHLRRPVRPGHAAPPPPWPGGGARRP